MLNYLRKSQNSIFIKAILGLVAASFVMFGTTSLFNQNTKEVLMHINQEPISLEEYYNEYNKLANITKSLEIKDKEKIHHLAIKSIINRNLILQEAKKLNMDISDESINKQIKKQFVNEETKKFDRQRFDRFLKYNGTTESSYINKVKESMLEEQLIYLTTNTLSTIPKSIVEKEYLLDNMKYNINYLILDNDSIKKNNKKEFKKLNISDEEIKDYYNKNKDDLFSEKRLDISYFIIDKEKKSDIEFYNLTKSIENQILSGMNIQQISSEMNIKLETKEIKSSEIEKLIKNKDELNIVENEIKILPGIKPYTKIVLQINTVHPKQYIDLSEVKDQITNILKKDKEYTLAKELIENNKEKISNILEKEGKIWGNKTVKTAVDKKMDNNLEFNINNIFNMNKNDTMIISDPENNKHAIIKLISLQEPAKIKEEDFAKYTVLARGKIKMDLYNRFINKLFDKANIEYNNKAIDKLGIFK